MFSEEYVDYYIEVLEQRGLFKSKKLNKKEVLPLVLSVANDISLQGMKRLSDDYKYYFFIYNMKVADSLNDINCKKYFVGDPNLFKHINMEEVIRKVFNELSPEELSGYLSALRASSKTQMMDNPKPKSLSKDEVESARDLLQAAIENYLSKKPEAVQKLILRGADISKASPRDACQFGRATYQAVYNIDNKLDRALVINYLLSD